MSSEKKITVPDIGGASGVDVIEVLVKVGEHIEKDAPLITLESEKASMEIPSPEAGLIKKIQVKVGDKVSEGDIILFLESTQTDNNHKNKISDESHPIETKNEPKTSNKDEIESQTVESVQEVKIPDIGGSTDVDVIDILIKPGDEIQQDQALITLEGDKATMDIPSPLAGKVESIKVKLGDKVSEGSSILTLRTSAASTKDTHQTETKNPIPPENKREEPIQVEKREEVSEFVSTGSNILAGPAVRRFARELGVDLSQVKGSGLKSRICKEDVIRFIKEKLNQKTNGGGFALPEAPVIDFNKFGPTEKITLNKIKRLTGQNLHRAWLTIPHVTQFDEADITNLEAFRKKEVKKQSADAPKLTILAFVCKVIAKALDAYPQFNASLDSSGESLIYKKYFNIGIAVDTPNGLVVPVIKGVDQLSVNDIAKEMGRLSQKARDKGLTPAEMSGGCFTISSLGGIGGTAFTPIVNSPEVAILGLSRASMKPIYKEDKFEPRLMLPLSLSYDHRVIDGAEAARFTKFVCDSLSDIRRILL